MKVCSACGVEKDESCFYRRKASPDGLTPRCQVCKGRADTAYKERNSSEVSKHAAAYYLANRDKKRAYDKTYYVANKHKIIQATARWRLAHPDAAAKWYRTNPEIKLASTRNRRALQKRVGGTHSAADVKRLLSLQKGRCPPCKADLFETGFDVDHVMPLVRGGHNGPRNLQLLCPTCNRRKHAKHPVDFMREAGYLL